jgi:hypothetical protein
MYENGKMRPVETVLRKGGGVNLRYTVSTFVMLYCTLSTTVT